MNERTNLSLCDCCNVSYTNVIDHHNQILSSMLLDFIFVSCAQLLIDRQDSSGVQIQIRVYCIVTRRLKLKKLNKQQCTVQQNNTIQDNEMKRNAMQ